MSFSAKTICDACGNETNSKAEVVGNAKDTSFLFNQSEESWGEQKEIVKLEAVTVKIFIECEGKEDFHLCYACLGSICSEMCESLAEKCGEDHDC